MNTKLIHDFASMQRHARALRRQFATAIVHSGGQQTIFGCVCGARHTCATSYRQARHVAEWRAEHENSCGARFGRLLDRREASWLDRQRAWIYNNDNH